MDIALGIGIALMAILIIYLWISTLRQERRAREAVREYLKTKLETGEDNVRK